MRSSAVRQRGAATLLFVLLAALAFMAASAAALRVSDGAQRVQYAEHVSTQSDLSAYAAVAVLSSAVASLPADAVLTPGAEVALTGVQPGVSARYVGAQHGFLVFRVTGASAGAKTVLQVAYRPPSATPGGTPPTELVIPNGQTLHGTTVLSGSIHYTGTGEQHLSVIGGSLTLQGSVTGLDSVCATGDVLVKSAIEVQTVCSNEDVTLEGGAAVETVSAIGNVWMKGGGTGIGSIHSNGTVTLSGGSSKANTVLATGKVSVTGGSARALTVHTESDIDWTSSSTASELIANGSVNYRTSANPAATDITALGNVMLTSARNVRTSGATTLVGHWGQGITGRLEGEGLLGGNSWGKNGGAIVQSGTVGALVTPHPKSVNVTLTPGLQVHIDALRVPAVPEFSEKPLTVDAWSLRSSANFEFIDMNASGAPIVRVANLNGIPDGLYYIASRADGHKNYLCKEVTGATCKEPLVKVCQGYSNNNACFSRSGDTWTIEGKTMLPSVAWFHGNLRLSNGVWVNTFIASGHITTSGSLKVYAPNYPNENYTCTGAADPANDLVALASHGLSGGHHPTQLCAGAPPTLSGASVGNLAILAGGYQEGVFSGGDVKLGASTQIYGAILAGQFLGTGGNTTVAGSVYSAAHGGTAHGENRQGGSTTIIMGGSAAYRPNAVPCMGCAPEPTAPANNIVWLSPI